MGSAGASLGQLIAMEAFEDLMDRMVASIAEGLLAGKSLSGCLAEGRAVLRGSVLDCLTVMAEDLHRRIEAG